jgi:RNA polymerase-binding transcription factor
MLGRMDADRARELLAAERERIVRQLEGRAADPSDEPALTDAADKASDTYEAELDEGLADDLQDQLEAVERADRRLADGTYGLSIESGEPIPDERLEVAPAAERTAEEQSRFDRGAL